MTGEPVVDGYLGTTTGAGKKIDSSELVVSTETVQRERAEISDSQANEDSRASGFTDDMETGLVVRGIYNKKVANAFWLLAHEVHLLRVVMEEATL